MITREHTGAYTHTHTPKEYTHTTDCRERRGGSRVARGQGFSALRRNLAQRTKRTSSVHTRKDINSTA